MVAQKITAAKMEDPELQPLPPNSSTAVNMSAASAEVHRVNISAEEKTEDEIPETAAAKAVNSFTNSHEKKQEAKVYAKALQKQKRKAAVDAAHAIAQAKTEGKAEGEAKAKKEAEPHSKAKTKVHAETKPKVNSTKAVKKAKVSADKEIAKAEHFLNKVKSGNALQLLITDDEDKHMPTLLNEPDRDQSALVQEGLDVVATGAVSDAFSATFEGDDAEDPDDVVDEMEMLSR
jgi:hypothetical protein